MNSHLSIREWSEDERPREKLFSKGVEQLSSAELLAILLRTGMRGQSALTMARNLLHQIGNLRGLSRLGLMQWKQIPGMGPAKISQVIAAFELGRRLAQEERLVPSQKISNSQEAAKLLMPQMEDLTREVVRVIFLDAQHRLIRIETVEEGTVNFAQPILREMFRKSLEVGAASIILAHNHPTGDLRASRADREFTRRVQQAALALQIRFLDHIIIGHGAFFSFSENNML